MGNEEVYLGGMISRDGRYEMDAERRVAAGNSVNGALAALLKSQSAQLHVWPYTMQC